MKTILAFLTIIIFCASACEKEKGNELKQELNITVKNESNSIFSNAKVVAYAANETPSDSLNIEIEKNSEVTYNWTPSLTTSVGTIYFYLTDSINEQILYYDGYSVLANQTDYIITVGTDSVLNIE
jgi:hypothetical protein